MKTILLSIENLENADTTFLQTAICFVIGIGFLFALLMMYHGYYLDKQREKLEGFDEQEIYNSEEHF